MKYFYTTLLLFQIIIINTSAQTWNTQMVNPGSISSPQKITYTSLGLPVVLLKSGTTMLLSFWDGNSWLNKSIVTQGNPIPRFIIRVDTTILVGYTYISTYNYFVLLTFDEVGNLKTQKSMNGVSTASITKSNSSDSVLIAYSYTTSTGIRMVSYNLISHTWGQNILVDGSPSLSGPSITVSPSDEVWLSYYDSAGKNLKVAKAGTAGDWDIYFVDTEGSVGAYSQIWVDNSNTAHIAYYDATNQKLKYATFNPD